MSSLKTEQYQLHQWEPGDSVLREEFNENFAKLDVSTRLFFGSYTGDGAAERLISLPITPKAVYLCTRGGKAGFIENYTEVYGGLTFADHPVARDSYWAARLADGGFEVREYDSGSYHIHCNEKNEVYHFVAFC